MKILLLVPAPQNISPGQRFRFEQYIGLDNTNLDFTVKAFFSYHTWKLLHQRKHISQKIIGIIGGFFKRFFTLFTIVQYDYIYIYREAAPIGPPIIEWLISRVFRKKIIYDFDDAIWLSLSSEANPFWPGLKCSWKVGNICSYSQLVTVGNTFLADFAGKYCKDVRIIPTVVNTETKHNRLKDHDEKPLFIGWTGTFTNFPNLKQIIPVIARLKEKNNFKFLIIADRDPEFIGVEYEFIKWDLETEIQDLLKLHIGLMPLANTERELGKCAFKAIQYMSLGITAVVSPVGANCDVVQDKENGFWADDDDEWYAIIEKLIQDKDLRQKTGLQSRQSILKNYSVAATRNAFSSLFRQ